jgi:hypothetical protein
MKAILKLIFPAQVLMVKTLWDSLSENEEKIILSNEDKLILDQRLAILHTFRNPQNWKNRK